MHQFICQRWLDVVQEKCVAQKKKKRREINDCLRSHKCKEGQEGCYVYVTYEYMRWGSAGQMTWSNDIIHGKRNCESFCDSIWRYIYYISFLLMNVAVSAIVWLSLFPRCWNTMRGDRMRASAAAVTGLQGLPRFVRKSKTALSNVRFVLKLLRVIQVCVCVCVCTSTPTVCVTHEWTQGVFSAPR